MEVGQLWRYPVKSMQGERVEAATVTEAGLTGDRAYAVLDPATGKVASAKHPRMWAELLRCRARYETAPTEGGPPPAVTITLPDGRETGSDDPDVDEHLSQLFGRPVKLTTASPEGAAYLAVWPEMDGVMPEEYRRDVAVPGDEPDGTLTDLPLAMAAPPGTFFDVAALHVVTTATLDHLDELQPGTSFSPERFRPNVVIACEGDPFAENEWMGAELELGALHASVLIPTMRCIMTTLAQDDLPRDNKVLRTLTEHNRVEIPGLGTWSCVGAYAAVTAAGDVAVGDAVSLAQP